MDQLEERHHEPTQGGTRELPNTVPPMPITIAGRADASPQKVGKSADDGTEVEVIVQRLDPFLRR